MRLKDLFGASEDENWRSHDKALQDTGFWGNAGAGALFMAKDTGRILFAHRSVAVEQPGTWGTWGGAIDQGEKPLEAVRREAYEEAGVDVVDEDIIALYVFKHESGFQYFNYLILVDNEFTPQLDWETQGSKWVEFGDWPQPLHFGPAGLFNDSDSFSTMQGLAQKFSGE